MTYLPRSDFVPFAEYLDAGEQININHEGCSAGHDSKKRLYIKRTDDGTILSHCHHCGDSGSYREDYIRRIKTKTQSSISRDRASNGLYRLPHDYTNVSGEWASKAKGWVIKYGITESEIKQYGIGYSETKQRVILPIYRKGKLRGYQTRKIVSEDPKPKYMTITNERPLFWTSNTSGSTLVVTEDVLSGIKCARYHPSLALLTSTPADAVIEWIVKQNYEDYIVFLDNDNRQVKQSQIAIKNRLELFGNVRVIHANKDPKEHSDSELKEVLR